MTGMQKLERSCNSTVRDTDRTVRWVPGAGAVSPQCTCLPDAATSAANKFAQLCRADMGKVSAVLARLAGEGREKREKGRAAGSNAGETCMETPARTRQGCLRHSRRQICLLKSTRTTDLFSHRRS